MMWTAIVKAVWVITWLLSEFMGYAGGMFVIYSVVAERSEAVRRLETAATFSSSLLTLVGTGLVAASIWLPQTRRRPWGHSYPIAVAVIVCCVAAVYFPFEEGELPQVLITGFGLLGISGGLKRLLPYPIEGSHAN